MTHYTIATTKADRELVARHRQIAHDFEYGVRSLNDCYKKPSGLKRKAYDKCVIRTVDILEENGLRLPNSKSHWGVTAFNCQMFVFTYTDEYITIVITPSRILVERY